MCEYILYRHTPHVHLIEYLTFRVYICIYVCVYICVCVKTIYVFFYIIYFLRFELQLHRISLYFKNMFIHIINIFIN